MKRFSLLIALVLVISTIFGAIGCAKEEVAPPAKPAEPTPPKETPTPEKPAPPAKVYTLKVAHGFSEDHPRNLCLLKFDEMAQAKTDGRVKLEIYPAGTLYTKDKDMMEATRINTIQGCVPSSAVISEVLSTTFPLSMVYLIRGHENLVAWYDDPVTQELMEQQGKAKGFKLLGFMYVASSMAGFVNNRAEIKDLQDLEGLKIRLPTGEGYKIIEDLHPCSIV